MLTEFYVIKYLRISQRDDLTQIRVSIVDSSFIIFYLYIYIYIK